jgi:syntaxin 1B/2/3
MSNINGFLNETIEIGQKLTNVKTNITKIQELQEQLFDNNISTTKEYSVTKERENLVSNTKNLLVEYKDYIKRFQYENSRVPSSDPNFGPRQQRYEYLRTKLSNVLEEYHQVESNFMKQTKDRMKRQYKVVNPNVTQREIDDFVSNSDSQSIYQQDLLKTNEAKNALEEVQKRHEYIKNIENTITELAALYQDLQLHGFQDQTIINNEQNVQGLHHENVQDTENNTICVIS